MKIEHTEIDPYKEGFRLRIWTMGKSRESGEEIPVYKEYFYPSLIQTLERALDKHLGQSQTAVEMIEMLSDSRAYIDDLVRSNGLLRTPERKRHRIDAKTRRWLEQTYVDGKWKTTHVGEKVKGRLYINQYAQ
jgi:hypothetical protein